MATRKTAAKNGVAARRKPGPKPKDAPTSNGAIETIDGTPNSSAPPPRRRDASFLFGLDESVSIQASGEEGVVRARAEWATGNICYFVAYTSSRGEFREAWVDQDLLISTAL